ncbi:MAG: hypothetical protein ABSG71_02525 [Thermodesulfobacteriota bacterium]|jgi:hypothetical protein
MAEGRFTAKKTGKTKEIQVKIEGKVMAITREDGKPPVVTGHEIGPIEDLVIDGQKIPNVFPDHTLIFTHTNPTCGYYYFNGRWWYRCV